MQSADGDDDAVAAAACCETDEQRLLLASVDASVYEDRVLREATHRRVPKLSGVSFPTLSALAPSYSRTGTADDDDGGTDSDAAAAAASDVPHFLVLLSRTRRRISEQQQQQQRLGDSVDGDMINELDKLYMKEQMLLSFLSDVARVPTDDLPVRPMEERAVEEKRSRAILAEHQSRRNAVAAAPAAEGDRVSTNTAGATSQTQQHRKRARVPIMERKRMEREEHQLTQQAKSSDDDFLQLREQLKKGREERERRKEERRGRARGRMNNDVSASGAEYSSTSSSEEEMEFENDIGAGDETTTSGSGELAPAVGAAASATTTTCPLCFGTVSSPNASELDTILSRHMDQCQRSRRRPSRGRQRVDSGTLRIGSDALDAGGELMSDDCKPVAKRPRKATNGMPSKASGSKPRQPVPSSTFLDTLDDLNEFDYEDRVDDWIANGLSRMKKMKERDDDEVPPGAVMLSNGLYIPGWINDRLFGYQREGLRWMWELHRQEAGGCLGDEMGLGKTVQVAAYLGALVASRKMNSVLIVAPATMLQHWLQELKVWAPGIRRILIHQSGESDGTSRTISSELLRALGRWLKRSRVDRMNEAIDDEDMQAMEPHSFCGTGYAVVTTYENLRRNVACYAGHDWSYIVLDEAQKIRNADADVTVACKRIRTPHRIAMSGTPIQNDLKELWSLFDFVFPGRLGTLPAFEQEFADPIRRGGYSNASPMQVQLAYRCALVLKDLIEPYLLRRQKKDVKEVSRMPGKTEHILFCRLSERQRLMYEAYLQSDDVTRVFRGTGNLLGALTMLRKIANHPDLCCDPDQASLESFIKSGNVDHSDLDVNSYSSGYDDQEVEGSNETVVSRAGKLEVLSKILPLWRKQGHRVLVFCQWRKMLNIIQRFMMVKGWKFGRLDGNTNIAARQRLVDSFNSDDSYFCMLCTTRTGGWSNLLSSMLPYIILRPHVSPNHCAYPVLFFCDLRGWAQSYWRRSNYTVRSRF